MRDFAYNFFIILVIVVFVFGLGSFIKWSIDVEKQEQQVIIDKIMSGEYNFVDLKRDMTGKYHSTEEFKVTYYTEGQDYKQIEITMTQFYELEEKFWNILEKKINY